MSIDLEIEKDSLLSKFDEHTQKIRETIEDRFGFLSYLTECNNSSTITIAKKFKRYEKIGGKARQICLSDMFRSVFMNATDGENTEIHYELKNFLTEMHGLLEELSLIHSNDRPFD